MIKKTITKWIFIVLAGMAIGISLFSLRPGSASPAAADGTIKWVDFDVSYEALEKAMEADIQSYRQKVHFDWTDTLAYLGASYGGDFSRYRSSDMDEYFAKRKKGTSVESLSRRMKFFSYYQKAYGAVLGGMLGTYKTQEPSPDGKSVVWKEKYGLKAFSPLAKNYWYTHYDDFGNSRSYGYDRKHFGHDLMASVGTPVIATESGTIEAIGWNQYGGWRLGIRSSDKKRYYYYAHLRKDHPYAENLYVGKTVTAGDVIGYTGQTGYSLRENTNNIDTPHLHYGMELIFEEKAKDSPNQIWVDLYALTRLLSHHQSEVYQKGKEYYRKYLFQEENYYLKQHGASSAAENANPEKSEAVKAESPAGSAHRASDEEEIPLPIIMYHSLLKEPAVKNQYVIHPDLFEEDLQYLKKHGYTTVLMQDLIDCTASGKPLPPKPVLLTFDDGFYNNYFYGYPLLKRYQMKAVISIIGKTTETFSESKDRNPAYAYLTWKDIRELNASGLVEIQNHSYNAHSNGKDRNGVSSNPGESRRAYRDFLQDQVLTLQEKLQKHAGFAPTTFTYPFGAFDRRSEQMLKEMGFQATLICTEGVNTIKKGQPDSLYGLKRYLRPPGKSSKEFFEEISKSGSR